MILVPGVTIEVPEEEEAPEFTFIIHHNPKKSLLIFNFIKEKKLPHSHIISAIATAIFTYFFLYNSGLDTGLH